MLLLSPLNKEGKRWRKNQMLFFFFFHLITGENLPVTRKWPLPQKTTSHALGILDNCRTRPRPLSGLLRGQDKRAAFPGSSHPSDPCLPQFPLPSCFSVLLGVFSRNIPWARTTVAALAISCNSKSSSGRSKISVFHLQFSPGPSWVFPSEPTHCRHILV